MVLGIVGLVLGWLFVPIICLVLAIIFASLAMQEVDRAPEPLGGRGMAVTGLVLGIVGLVGWGAVIIAVLATRGG
jgi:hypothetical protein